MIDLHVPTDPDPRSVKECVGYITNGLDAVIIEPHERSSVYEGYMHFRITGNQRDLATAVDRASKIGGVVD